MTQSRFIPLTRDRRVRLDLGAGRSFWESDQAPTWANDWGWVEYGAWSEFSVEGKIGTPVVQRMRWIEPGTFQMGSPEDEPSRSDDEGARHEVRVEEGFWLFDTACTQALWEAVVGENPAHFKGVTRPVEMVSWDDAQRFMVTLNKQLPGMELRLPSDGAAWPAEDPGAARVIRGGSWDYDAGDCRCASRYGSVPENWSTYLGFRCVRVQV